jgi:hypothetical protein
VNLGITMWVVPDGGLGALRRWFEGAYGRLGVGVWPILQTALAASLAWFLVSGVLGHGQPYFAAIAAVISTGVVVGARRASGVRTRLLGGVRACGSGSAGGANRDGDRPDRGRRAGDGRGVVARGWAGGPSPRRA